MASRKKSSKKKNKTTKKKSRVEKPNNKKTIKEISEETDIPQEFLEKLEEDSIKLKPKHMVTIKTLVKNGCTNNQIMSILDVSCSTYYRWRDRHPEIFKVLETWKDYADSEVEKSLYQCAIGYTTYETKVISNKDGIVTKVMKIPVEHTPDVTAQMKWLHNRKPDKWRKNPVDNTNSDDKLGQLVKLFKKTAEEIDS